MPHVTAENDVLRDEGEAYGHKLIEAGVEVVTTRYNATIHDFVMLNGLAEAAPTRGSDASRRFSEERTRSKAERKT